MQEISLGEAPKKLREGSILLLRNQNGFFFLGDARNSEIMSTLRQIKSREESKGFTIWVDSDARLNRCVKEVPALAWDIFDTSKGSVVLILPDGQNLAPESLSDDGSVAVKMLEDREEIQIVRSFNGPVAATQAILSSGEPVKQVKEIPDEVLNQVDYLLTLHPFIYRKGTKKISIIRLEKDNQVKIIRE